MDRYIHHHLPAYRSTLHPNKMAVKQLQLALFFVFAFASTGCYHAMVTTGLTPSTVTIDEKFASGWIYGLVPPKTVETAAKCTDGVAMVETELSFVNQLVGAITFGIYTPMHIKVTCAMAGSASVDSTGADIMIATEARSDEVITSFEIAADRAVENGEPVYVRFQPAISE